MKAIIGLGNPGVRYERTRHNIGWMVLEAIASALRATFVAGRGEYYEAVGRWRGSDVRLIKPTTFMNLSGIAARQVRERYGLAPEEMLVIVDEIQFPTGRVQLRPTGSSGGHNGLESLIEHLGTEGFPRLRCGVDKEFERGAMAEYVLSPFPEHEAALVAQMIESGRELALSWLVHGTGKAMSEHARALRAAEGRETRDDVNNSCAQPGGAH